MKVPNCWIISRNIWFFTFMMQQHTEQASPRQKLRRYRRWLHVEHLKMIVGIPLSFAATWFLVFDPWHGYSLQEMLTTYSTLPPLGMLFWLPIIATLCILVVSASAYTFIGVMFLLGWVQVRYFGFPKL